MARSGLESLLQALGASGVDTSEVGGSAPQDGANADSSQGANGASANATNAQGADSAKASTNNNANAKGAKGQQPGNLGDIPKAIMDMPIVDKVKNWSTKGKVIGIIVLLVILAIAYWWFHPPINIQSETTWMIGIILILLPLFLFFRSKRNKYKEQSDENKTTKTMLKKENEKKANKYRKLAWIPLGIVALGLIGLLCSASFFPGNAEKYATVLKTDDCDFTTDIPQVNYNQIPIIDRDTARVLGTKEMGTISDYVSQFEISNLYSQINYQGKPVRVSPLTYADLFKWLMNREEGIPAYCLIDMATQDASIVRVADVDGVQGEGIKYSESEPLARNIERYIQLKYPFYMFDEFSFEIDEDGHPWWICPVQAKTIGLFGGTTIQRVILCDAVSGECTDMDINDVPQWTDRVYPSDLLIEQYNWSGKYSKGWLNSWLGQSGVVKTTPGGTTKVSSSSNSSSSSSVSTGLGYNYIAKDDDVWVYTGVTSATSDTSIVGFILINQRTQESHFYSVSGATEAAAMESAEGQVQQMRYTATFPILINISNVPTYFIALKDGAGLVKKFAMIDIQRYQNVAIGDSVAECQKSYQELLIKQGINLTQAADLSDNATGVEASGTIATMSQAVVDGNSHFYITLAGDSKIYSFAVPGLLKIVTYKVGDPIHFQYTEGDKAAVATNIL